MEIYPGGATLSSFNKGTGMQFPDYDSWCLALL